MKKIIVLAAAFLSCTAQQFNPPVVNSDQVVPGATVGNCLKANPGHYLTSGSCGAGGATVPTPSATGQMISSINGSAFSLLNIGTTGQVLTVVGGVPAWAASGGGGGSNFPTGITTGVPGSDGPFATVASAGGPVGFTTNILATCGAGGATANDLLISDSGNGHIVCLDNAGNLEILGQFDANGGINSFGGPIVSDTGVRAPVFFQTSPGFSSFGGYTDTSGSMATMQLGQTGAPSGACNSGSIYTRNDGGAGTTLYGCYSSTWHAATTP
jgi:hypothetical protein